MSSDEHKEECDLCCQLVSEDELALLGNDLWVCEDCFWVGHEETRVEE